VLVWETHVAYQHPKAAKLGSPISSTVTTYFCTMSLKCLRYEREGTPWGQTPGSDPLIASLPCWGQSYVTLGATRVDPN